MPVMRSTEIRSLALLFASLFLTIAYAVSLAVIGGAEDPSSSGGYVVKRLMSVETEAVSKGSWVTLQSFKCLMIVGAGFSPPAMIFFITSVLKNMRSEFVRRTHPEVVRAARMVALMMCVCIWSIGLGFQVPILLKNM